MTKWKLRLLGVGILVLGVVLAQPFRRAAPGFPSQMEYPVRPDLQLQHLVEASPHEAPPKQPADNEPDPIAPRLNPLASEPHDNAPASNTDLQTTRNGPALPTMPAKYQPALRPMLPPKPKSPDEKPRKHELVDGDSLPDLAERYLGNANRYVEILAANPTLEAELLPLGEVIVIPPKIAAPAKPSSAQTRLVPVAR